MTEKVNNPDHYNSLPAKCSCGKQIECIQVTEHMDFNLGNAIKYLWRADHKGTPVEDLEKAVWYIKREISRLVSPPDKKDLICVSCGYFTGTAFNVCGPCSQVMRKKFEEQESKTLDNRRQC